MQNDNSDIATEFRKLLAVSGYMAEDGLTTTLALAHHLKRPVLLEGRTGVGKTEVALALAAAWNCKLIRLQCYEGLDLNAAVYEWNYHRQLLALKIREGSDLADEELEKDVFGRRYLLERPLLQSITSAEPTTLLIDEIDRADEEFEAYVLELLADFQITVPELGTIKARSIPRVFLTSNGTRELSDALRRRCLYYYLDYPSFEKEMRILRARIPAVQETLAAQVVAFVQELRGLDLRRHPGVAETLDWASALIHLNVSTLTDSPETVFDSLACLLKTKEDRQFLNQNEVKALLDLSGKQHQPYRL